MVSLTKESRTANPRSPPRWGSYRDRGTNIGACSGRACRASRTLHGRRLTAISDGSRTTQPIPGIASPENHEASTVEGDAVSAPRRPRAALSGIAEILALLRIIVFFEQVPHRHFRLLSSFTTMSG